jgi:hypothetical protein
MNPTHHNLRNFKLDFHIHKHHLPADFRHEAEKFLDFCAFYYDAFQACSRLLIPRLNKLMLRHYPATAKATHPAQVQYINDTNEGHLFGLFTDLRNLLHEQEQGVNILEKYPKLESWREFYCKPSQPATLDDKLRNIYLYPNDEDWKKHQAEENRLLKILHDWQETRKNEYYDLVQPLLFEYLPKLNDLDGDFWVLYAVTLRDNYEEWTSCCEHLETAIEYHMPPKSINWKTEDFKKALRENRPHYSKQVDEQRHQMIFGSPNS